MNNDEIVAPGEVMDTASVYRLGAVLESFRYAVQIGRVPYALAKRVLKR